MVPVPPWIRRNRTRRNRPRPLRSESAGRSKTTGWSLALGSRRRLAGLAVRGVLVAPAAVLLQLHAVRVVAAVLLGDVVAPLALGAREGDLRPDVDSSHWGASFCSSRAPDLPRSALTMDNPASLPCRIEGFRTMR